MAINVLYISHQNYDWDKNGNTNQLINESNLEKIIKLSESIDCKTSVEDLGYYSIDLAINNAESVELVDFDFLQYNDTNFAAYGRLLNALQKKTNSKLVKVDINLLKESNRNQKSVLWTAGCSFTESEDLPEQVTWRYLLGQKLQKEVFNLARSGTSIWWSADQILRSDIRPGDIVVWGITNATRMEYSQNWDMKPINLVNYNTTPRNYWSIDYFESETQILFCLRSIHQVINFCNKIGAEIYIVNLLDINWVSSLMKSHPNFLDLVDKLERGHAIKCIDYAKDQLHPGPKQHNYYANKIYQFIKEKQSWQNHLT